MREGRLVVLAGHNGVCVPSPVGTGASPEASPLSPQVLGNATAARYVAGVGVHWYLDSIVPASCSLEATHKLFPNHFLLYTEACSGFLTYRFSVSLGCWERGDRYSHSILTVRPLLAWLRAQRGRPEPLSLLPRS